MGWLRKYWPILLVILIVIVALAIIGWKIYSWYDSQPWEFKCTYSGISWIRCEGTNTESIEVSFDGERSKDLAFHGDITIKKGSETVYQYLDCYVYYKATSDYYLIYPEPLAEDVISQNAYKCEPHYGYLLASEDWSQVTFVFLSDLPEGKNGTIDEVYTAPARDLSEAVAVSAEIAKGTIFEGNFHLH